MRLKSLFLFISLSVFFSAFSASASLVSSHEDADYQRLQAVRDLLRRIGGDTAPSRFELRLDPSLSVDGRDSFVISDEYGVPAVAGSSLSAITTGINWYLNHYAGVNIAWNNPFVDLSSVSLPLPEAPEVHVSSADYRYYLNYCTFSYSMSTWTWERWQQEIDWMALHGINIPLQIVGLEEVWRRMLTLDYGYSQEEASRFIAGPAFMAWFGMNNLEGWGGPNPEWWYLRQAALAEKINSRMRELGIQPVLPGFSGMVPSDFTAKTGIPAADQGKWCGFQRPNILDATSGDFQDVAANYYRRLHEVMGESGFYSIDPFHEGGAAPGDVDLAYRNLFQAMDSASRGSRFVIQSWQWSPAQRKCLDNIPYGRLLVLDLFSDGRPDLNAYKGHDTVYSTIFNFGGRTGFFGRFGKVIDGYFDAVDSIPSVRGIGAAPEAIEQTPVMYDLLFELPWMSLKPDPEIWMREYADRRYGVESPKAREAWQIFRTSALDCRSSLQGPHEATVCARPALEVKRVSSWGGTEIFYDTQLFAQGVQALLDANLSGENYEYDVVDLTRQAITDLSQSMLVKMKDAHEASDSLRFRSLSADFIELMADIDSLLCCNSNFMLGNWTGRARMIADEVPFTSDADRDWLELDNARTLITTWGPEGPARGLRDYSYREWGGMLRDFYIPRWKVWLDSGLKEPEAGWFAMEWDWAHDASLRYDMETKGDAPELARRLMSKYFPAGSQTRH